MSGSFWRTWVMGLIALLYLFAASSLAQAQSGMRLLVHWVQAEPQPGKVAYTVRVYLSVLDASGQPVKGLTAGNFSLAEDAQAQKLEAAEPVLNEAISLVLVMDTSGSMAGQGIVDARNAAALFLQRLGSNDQAAVISFNHTITTLIGFTNDHASSSEAVKQLNVLPNGGTCLYDAAYQAVELAAGAPSGRRAVILFTDGKDEAYSGGKCSFHEVQDVIDLAKAVAVPVYTLGLGGKVDERELRRIATGTGGSFLASRNSSELDSLFSRLYDQLNNQYVLTYTSNGAPGAHNLTVSVTYHSQSDQTVYAFNLPALPTTITLTSPAEGETLSGKVLIKAKLLTQGAEIASVEFAANGVVVGKDISEPYEYEWDTSQQPAGEILLEAVAIGKDGAELARTGFKVTLAESPPAAAEMAGEEAQETSSQAETQAEEKTTRQTLLQSRYLPFFAVGGGVLLIGLVAVIVLSARRHKTKRAPGEESFELKRVGGEEATFDGLDLRRSASAGAEVARLTVLASDDPAIIGNQYSLTTFPLVLGRSAEQADIVFPNKDLAVSRRHARLELSGRQIVLYDMGSKYGSFVNDQPVGASPVALNHGDEVRLGSRVRLRFEFVQPPKAGEDETFDGLSASSLQDELDDRETRQAV